jgi:hypothetical protein
MWVALALVAAIVGGVLSPFSNRLHGTSRWAGRALAEPTTAQPDTRQDAITTGWPGTLVFATTGLRLTALVLALIQGWWTLLLVVAVDATGFLLASRLPLTPVTLDRYLTLLLQRAARRQAAFHKAGDATRAELAGRQATALEGLLHLYRGKDIPAPEGALAREAPLGDREYLLRLASEADAPRDLGD